MDKYVKVTSENSMTHEQSTCRENCCTEDIEKDDDSDDKPNDVKDDGHIVDDSIGSLNSNVKNDGQIVDDSIGSLNSNVKNDGQIVDDSIGSLNDNVMDEDQNDDDSDDSQVISNNETVHEHNNTESDDKRNNDVNYKKENEEFVSYVAHETELSEGGEADLHKHLVGCKKNPGHKKFVPVCDFNINHMPEGYIDNDLVEYIKATSDLTVRVHVKMTSKERPDIWPNTQVLYAFSNMRGSDVMRLGTGMVCHVFKYTEEFSMGTCPCQKCEHADTPSNVWGVIEITTATHVVFDDLEAEQTTCRFFYDRQESPLVTLDDWTMVKANIEEDVCVLYCVSCDVDLLDKLEKMWRHWRDLWDKVDNKYKSSRDVGKWTFIVSHPHGCPKQISVGHWLNRYEVRDGWSKYTYSTCTCPGSSGAHVQPIGYTDWYYFDRHVHSGVSCSGINFSGIGRDYYN